MFLMALRIHFLFIPNTEFELTAQSEILDIALGWCETTEDHPAQFKSRRICYFEIRGGDNATRQINFLIEPDFDCQRLVSVEVYTPSGKLEFLSCT